MSPFELFLHLKQAALPPRMLPPSKSHLVRCSETALVLPQGIRSPRLKLSVQDTMSHVLLTYTWSHIGQQEARTFVGELLPKALPFPTAALVVLQTPGHLGADGTLPGGAGAVLRLPSPGQPSVPAKISDSAMKVSAPARKTITQSHRTGYNLFDDNEIACLLSDSFSFMCSRWKNASSVSRRGARGLRAQGNVPSRRQKSPRGSSSPRPRARQGSP